MIHDIVCTNIFIYLYFCVLKSVVYSVSSIFEFYSQNFEKTTNMFIWYQCYIVSEEFKSLVSFSLQP